MRGFKPVRKSRRWALRSTIALIALSQVAGGLTLAESDDGISLNHLVLSWMQGNYATPLVCKIAGDSRRGLRRILIDPPDFKKKIPESLVHFEDLEADDAERCFTEIGGDTPNIVGELVVRHPITKLRDTARRDFKLELRRNRGFELDIVSGSLVFAAVGSNAAPASTVDFRGGTFRVHILRQGSDALRLLADLPSPRKVLLEVATRDGQQYSFASSLSKSISGSGAPTGSARRPPASP